MSMRNFANHGHTVKASDLAKLLPTEKQADYLKLLEDGDWDTAQDVLKEYLPENFPVPDLFLMQDKFMFRWRRRE